MVNDFFLPASADLKNESTLPQWTIFKLIVPLNNVHLYTFSWKNMMDPAVWPLVPPGWGGGGHQRTESRKGGMAHLGIDSTEGGH